MVEVVSPVVQAGNAVVEVVSPSLGSRARDHEVTVTIGGRVCHIRRIGTDGDFEALRRLYRDLDGNVDAIGMGGIDAGFQIHARRYEIRDAKKLLAEAPRTPVVDGSGLKETLEREAVRAMAAEGYPLAGRKVLMVSAVDRFGMAEALHAAGADIVFGDLIFGLGVPVAIRSWATFNVLARLLLPIVVRLPFSALYPTGGEQDKPSRPGRARYYDAADVIAGDFLYVRRHMPADMRGKWVITNTTTAVDVADLESRGVELLVTTTPVFEGRSFGTNVIEALLVALAGGGRPLTTERCAAAARELGLAPTIRRLGGGS